MAKQKVLLMLLRRDIHRLEYDPATQYKFHFWATWFWLLNMPVLLVLLIWFPRWWLQISVFYIAEASVWALVATHLGAMSAALAATQASKIPTNQSRQNPTTEHELGSIPNARENGREMAQVPEFDA